MTRVTAYVLLAAAACAGCRGSSAQATGKVTLDKEPVADAEVIFTPEARPEASVFGKSGPDGTYRLTYPTPDALPAGSYKVTVTRYLLRDGRPLPPGEEGAALRADEKRVVRHTYSFEKAVTAGRNQIDLELSEGKKQ